MDGFLITIIVLSVYLAIVTILQKKKILEKHNMSLWGPVLMVRTHKGEKLIESASKLKRLWGAVGPVSIVLCAALGALLMPLLIWNAILSFQLPVEATPSPFLVIGVPGINPIMSGSNLWYAILGLVVAIIVHEGMHGVMTRFAGVKLKSVGLMFLAIPLGAFAEPDDEGVNKLSRFKRSRLFAAGPFANLVLAVVFGLIFSAAFMGAVEVKADGAGILSVGENSPAENSTLQPGMIITAMDNNPITNRTEYLNFLATRSPGDNISITIYGGKTCFAVLAKATDYGYNESYANKSYLGVATVGTRDAKETYDGLRNPFSNMGNFLSYILLPLFQMQTGISPLQAPYTEFFTTPIPAGIFWVLANAIYWIFWVSLMLATTNVLPAVPMDGGYIFKDGLDWILSKFKVKEEKRAKISNTAALAVSFTILGLVVIQFIGPYIGAFFAGL